MLRRSVRAWSSWSYGGGILLADTGVETKDDRHVVHDADFDVGAGVAMQQNRGRTGGRIQGPGGIAVDQFGPIDEHLDQVVVFWPSAPITSCRQT